MYSYKNCYGLSIIDKKFGKLTIIEYSYKNCYGLSANPGSGAGAGGLYSYKNCYGLSWWFGEKHRATTKYSYKNCYGLSEEKANQLLQKY